jgi:hypothetical protein
MIRLYSGSGSQEIILEGETMPRPEWERRRGVAASLLERRGLTEAAELLRLLPFGLYEATNGFADEFNVLYLSVPLDRYVELSGMAEDASARRHFREIANVVTEIGIFIRFIALEVDEEVGPEPVPRPSLSITSNVVERALADAERLIATQGATSGVDRVHTALHGYLRGVAAQTGISPAGDASITEMFKLLRERHPRLCGQGPRQGDIDSVLRAMANIVHVLNPVRNQASVAHPNELLLDEPEAMLIINTVRTLLHYVDARMSAK